MTQARPPRSNSSLSVLASMGSSSALQARLLVAFTLGLAVSISLSQLALAVLAVLQVWGCPATPPAWPLLGRLLRKCERAHAFYSIYMTLAGVLTLVLLAALPRVLHARRQAAWMMPGWMVGVIALGLTY